MSAALRKLREGDKSCFRISSLRVILLSGIKARRSVDGGGRGGQGGEVGGGDRRGEAEGVEASR